jgi:sterol desaturase/sphingolipid hydroxylase (fatty acid hydroxylase superfamily)
MGAGAELNHDNGIKKMNIFRKIFTYEKRRFANNQYLRLLGLLFFLSYFYFFPSLVMMITGDVSEHQNLGYITSYYIIFFANGIMLVWNLVYFLIYHMNNPFFEQFKISDTPYEWETDKEKWRESFNTLIKSNLIISLIYLPIAVLPNLFNNEAQYRMDYESFPTMIESMTHFLFCHITAEFFFTFTHYLFHTKYLYKFFHKVHHEFREPISLGVVHENLVDYLFGSVVPFAIGPILLGKRMHWASYFSNIVLNGMLGVDDHSGYNFPWYPLNWLFFIGNDSQFHYYHHMYINGNYGQNYVMDLLLGTVVKPFEKKYFSEEQEIKKND